MLKSLDCHKLIRSTKLKVEVVWLATRKQPLLVSTTTDRRWTSNDYIKFDCIRYKENVVISYSRIVLDIKMNVKLVIMYCIWFWTIIIWVSVNSIIVFIKKHIFMKYQIYLFSIIHFVVYKSIFFHVARMNCPFRIRDGIRHHPWMGSKGTLQKFNIFA